MQHSLPPLFKQGTPVRVRVVIYIFAAIVMLMVDSRLHSLVHVRQVIGFILYPFQQIVMMPRNAVYAIGDYFSSVTSLQSEVNALRKKELDNAPKYQQAEQLITENAHLRELLKLNKRLPVQSLPAEILHDARIMYARKVILNRGANDGIVLGQPVIDENGIIGQITRVFFSTSEATLLIDKDQAIPVQVARTGMRGVVYGLGKVGYLEFRFLEADADIQPGDMLVTSGIDGLYPSGLAVGEVINANSESSEAINHIICRPTAGLERSRQVLVLLTNVDKQYELQEEDTSLTGKTRREADIATARKKAGVK